MCNITQLESTRRMVEVEDIVEEHVGFRGLNNINLTQAFQHDHTRSKEQKVRSTIKDHCKISLDKI